MAQIVLKISFLVLAGVGYWYLSHLELPGHLSFLKDIFRFLLFVIGLDVLFFTLAKIYRRGKKMAYRDKDNITVGLKNLYYFLIFISFVLLTLSFLNVDLKTLFTTLSIVAAAIAIVSKEFISPLIGGFIITFSSELSIGDEVKIGEHKGKIQDIKLNKIALKTEDDDIIFIPSDKAYNGEIINFTKVTNKRVNVRFELPITAITSVEELEKDLIQTLEEYKTYINDDSYILKVTKLEKDGISFTFQYTLGQSDGELEKEIRRKTIRKVVNQLASQVGPEDLKLLS